MRKKGELGKTPEFPFEGPVTQGGKCKEKEQVSEKGTEFCFGLTEFEVVSG